MLSDWKTYQQSFQGQDQGVTRLVIEGAQVGARHKQLGEAAAEVAQPGQRIGCVG